MQQPRRDRGQWPLDAALAAFIAVTLAPLLAARLSFSLALSCPHFRNASARQLSEYILAAVCCHQLLIACSPNRSLALAMPAAADVTVNDDAATMATTNGRHNDYDNDNIVAAPSDRQLSPGYVSQNDASCFGNRKA